MSTVYFPTIANWRIPSEALRLALVEMAADGRRGTEGIALWLGRREQGVADITHVVLLRGPGVVRAPDFVRVSPDLFNEIAGVAAAADIVLVGQIHSHGPLAGTALSRTDRMGGIVVPQYLSVVAPNYAQSSQQAIETCGVHIFEQNGWRRLTLSEIADQLRMTDGQVTQLTVGEAQ